MGSLCRRWAGRRTGGCGGTDVHAHLGAMLSQRVLHLHQVGQLARRVLVCRRQQLVEEFVWHIRSADIGVAGEPGVVLHHAAG
eukprot:1170-Chlamydomonas_euryale.AAC.1